MVWNIQAFGMSKFNNNAFDNVGARAGFIVGTIQQAAPDILVLVEVRTGQQQGVGSLVSDTSGGPAVRTLLNRINGNQDPPNGVWRTVPPLVINPNIGRRRDTAYSEGVGVLYRSDRLDFTGPWKWTAGGSQPIGGPGAATAYPAPWVGYLPAAPPWNNAPALNQDQLAGQSLFYDGNNPPQQILFPDVFARNPWLTTFVENTGLPASRRTFKLFTVHFPPNPAGSRDATAKLADVPEVTGALAPNEIRAIMGDFNVNSVDPNYNDVFDQLTNDTQVVISSDSTDLYTQHFAEMTVVSDVKQAKTSGVAPYYGYGKKLFGQWAGLDNVLTAYHAGAPANPAVANRVIGAPAPYTVSGTSIPILNNLRNPPTNWPVPTIYRLFRSLANFGKIGGKIGASDHLPLVIDL